MIEITEAQTNRVNAILGGIKNAQNKVFYNVINRALATVRSQSGKLVTAVYQIRNRDFREYTKIRNSKASATNMAGEIEFAGTVIPLIKFKVSPKEPKHKTVSVSVMRAQGGKRLEMAYVADLGLYGVGVFERMTSKRETSKQLYGPSAAHMMENAEVIEQVEKLAQETVDKRVEQEISRILNGYGG